MNIGIDKIGFYAPNHYIEMRDLAVWRGVDPDKYTIGLGQDQMAVVPPTQDTVTLAANAAFNILNKDDLATIDLVLFATESGLDYSKSMAVYVHRLLGIQPKARCLEVKEACYAATGAIQLGRSHIASHPDRKVLILASDISRYGLNTSGEPTQGAGAVAILLSANPQILIIEEDAAVYTDDIMDFWRPNYSDVAFVDGKYSNEQYQRFFTETFMQYSSDTKRTLNDFKAMCFHIPYTKIGLKALRSIADETSDSHLFERFVASTKYNRRVGNIYTGSLYLNLISLLDNNGLNKDDRIGFFSYGSGAVGEFFSGLIVDGYHNAMTIDHQAHLDNRTKLSLDEYETMYNFSFQPGESVQLDSSKDTGHFILAAIMNHQRIYEINPKEKPL